ncbi:MAG: KTSC domain-containing protein [Bacteroidota bacterium]
MRRTPVSSSNLASVGYDAATKMLEIKFNSGSVYIYSGVPASVYTGLMHASSHGSYFHAHIRNSYSYRRIR